MHTRLRVYIYTYIFIFLFMYVCLRADVNPLFTYYRIMYIFINNGAKHVHMC